MQGEPLRKWTITTVKWTTATGGLNSYILPTRCLFLLHQIRFYFSNSESSTSGGSSDSDTSDTDYPVTRKDRNQVCNRIKGHQYFNYDPLRWGVLTWSVQGRRGRVGCASGSNNLVRTSCAKAAKGWGSETWKNPAARAHQTCQSCRKLFRVLFPTAAYPLMTWIRKPMTLRRLKCDPQKTTTTRWIWLSNLRPPMPFRPRKDRLASDQRRVWLASYLPGFQWFSLLWWTYYFVVYRLCCAIRCRFLSSFFTD